MTDSKSKAKNTVTYPVRVSPDLRKAFTEACDANDSNGSREIREFMRKYISKYGQKDLF